MPRMSNAIIEMVCKFEMVGAKAPKSMELSWEDFLRLEAEYAWAAGVTVSFKPAGRSFESNRMEATINTPGGPVRIWTER